jgi:phage N-6-adenine-methyltransferase
MSVGRRLCAACRAPLQQPATGRSRRYCSDACRQAAHRKRTRRLRSTREVLGSSRSDNWPTDPAAFADIERQYGPFDLDPCASHENAKCARYFTREDNGLAQRWFGRVFMNPPYGRELPQWMAKAWESSQSTAEVVVCLIPARTDTRYWHDYAMRGDITFLRGRLKFGPLTNPAPFPSAVVVFRNASGRNETVESLLHIVS